MSRTFSSLSGRRPGTQRNCTQLELPFDAPLPLAGPPRASPPALAPGGNAAIPPPAVAVENKAPEAPAKPGLGERSDKAVRHGEGLNGTARALEKENVPGRTGESGRNIQASKEARAMPEAKNQTIAAGAARREAAAQSSVPKPGRESFIRRFPVGRPESFLGSSRFPSMTASGAALLVGALVIVLAALALFMRAGAPAKKASASVSNQFSASPAPSPALQAPAAGPAADPGMSALPASAPEPGHGLPGAAAPGPAAWPDISVPGVRVTAASNELLVVFAESLFSARAELSEDGRRRLLKVAGACAGRAPEFQFVFQGHADPGRITSGAFPDNRALAQARADAALALWRDHGKILASSLKAISKGEDSPPYPNTTPEMRRRNRTVTIRILRK